MTCSLTLAAPPLSWYIRNLLSADKSLSHAHHLTGQKKGLNVSTYHLEFNRHRAHHPTALAQQAAKKEFQHVKSAQITKQKTSGKAMSSKALNRNNKALFASGSKKHVTRQSFNIKMAGANKNLKQC